MSTVQQIPTTQSGFDCQILEEEPYAFSFSANYPCRKRGGLLA